MKTKILKGVAALTLILSMVGTVNANADSTTNVAVTVSTTVDPTITLSLSTNNINFGAISPLTPTYNQNLTATVQSNNTYNLSVVAVDDFKGTVDTTKVMTIDHLGVKLDSDSSYKTMSKTADVALVSNATNTASQTYNVNLQLNTDWQVKPDTYTTSLTFKAVQV